jgi:hypothetical protein
MQIAKLPHATVDAVGRLFTEFVMKASQEEKRPPEEKKDPQPDVTPLRDPTPNPIPGRGPLQTIPSTNIPPNPSPS